MKEMYEGGYLMPEWILHTGWLMLLCHNINQNEWFWGGGQKPNEAELFLEIHEWIDRQYVVLI